MQELDGRVALVTGGGGGIGRAIALTLAGEGMRVVVADVEADAAETVAAELAASGAEASAETVDVSDPAAVEALADRCNERYGGVDVLCNHAGVVGPTPIGAESLDNWRWVVDVNVLGLVHSINAFVPKMLARIGAEGGEAHVVNASSIAGLLAGGRWEISAYRASQLAIVGMSRDLRGELAGSGIGVTVLCPGAVATRMWQAGRNRPAERGGPEAYQRPSGLDGRVIDPLEVGRRALHAIRENQLYAITHPERRDVVEATTRDLLDAFDLAAETPV